MDANHALVLQALQLLGHLLGLQRLALDHHASDVAGELGPDDSAVALDALEEDGGRVSEVALDLLGNVPVVEEHVLLDGQRGELDAGEMALERLVSAEVAEALGAAAIVAGEEGEHEVSVHRVGDADEELQRVDGERVCVGLARRGLPG